MPVGWANGTAEYLIIKQVNVYLELIYLRSGELWCDCGLEMLKIGSNNEHLVKLFHFWYVEDHLSQPLQIDSLACKALLSAIINVFDSCLFLSYLIIISY